MRDSIADGQHDYRPVVALGQLARRKSDNSRLPVRPGKDQHATIQFSRVGGQLAFNFSENAILEQFAPLIRVLSHSCKSLRLPWVTIDEQLVGRTGIVQATWRIEARRYLEGDLAARECPDIDT